MKANVKAKSLKQDTSAYTKMVGGLVALLLTVIVGWNHVKNQNGKIADPGESVGLLGSQRQHRIR